MLEQLKRWLDEQQRKPSDICVVARTNKLVESRYAPLLQAAGYETQIVKTDEGIRLATMQRIKGLEFPCVLLASVNHGDMPLELKRYADDTDKTNHYDTEKRLLFVAATRARDELVVTDYGAKSVFWQALERSYGYFWFNEALSARATLLPTKGIHVLIQRTGAKDWFWKSTIRTATNSDAR